MNTQWKPTCTILALLLVVGPACLHADEVWPMPQWEKAKPADVGMDEAMLEKARDYALTGGGSGYITRHGKLVMSWGDPRQRYGLKSTTKSIGVTALALAIADGKIRLEDKASKHHPTLAVPPESNEKTGWIDDITIQHLATQTAGFQKPGGYTKLIYKPGTKWAYSDGGPNWLAECVTLKYKRDVSELLFERVFGPLGITSKDLSWRRNSYRNAKIDGVMRREFGSGISANVDAMARIGYLYLRNGKWKDKQLIPKSFVEKASSTFDDVVGLPEVDAKRFGNASDHYGLLWWNNADGTLKNVPRDAYWSWGLYESLIVVIPSFDIVVARAGRSWKRDWAGHYDVLQPFFDPIVASVDSCGDEVGESHCTKWSSHELVFEGPMSQSRGKPNPFDVRLDVTFTSPTGKRYVVPGFYAGDGKGGDSGSVWKARLSPDIVGQWSYTTKSPNAQLNGQRGSFVVDPVSARAQGFWKWGRLEVVGTPENRLRYLKFHDGPFWLKAGCDDPENFLGRYRNFDTLKKRKAAVMYLASKGINSLYIMTHNIGGDDNDVWPWLGKSAGEAKKNAVAGNVRFDNAKLAEWRALFEFMQTKGVVPYLILEDDSAWKAYDHDRYYREILARFGDLPAVVFNMGEENNENYKLPEGLKLAERFSKLDPYGRPLGIHNVNAPKDSYIDSPHIDMTAIQTGSPGSRKGLAHSLQHNRIAIDWIERCRKQKTRVLMVNFDEGRPEHDRRAWWSAYLGGGVWEAHVLRPYDRPLTTWDKVWTELGGTRTFMESVPFWEMTPDNEIVKEGQALCLAKPGEAYVLYLPVGGEITVELQAGNEYEARWWKPTQGLDGMFQQGQQVSGGARTFTAPTKDDWALRIRVNK